MNRVNESLIMTLVQIKKVTSWAADLKFAKNIFKSFVRKRVLTECLQKVWTDFLEEAVFVSFVEKNGIMFCNISRMICSRPSNFFFF